MKKLLSLILFVLLATSVSALEITLPTPDTYNVEDIATSFGHDNELESLGYTIDNGEYVEVCTACSSTRMILYFTRGEHTITARGTVNGETYEDSVTIFINISEEATTCCTEATAECLACEEGVTIEEYCVMNPEIIGCEVPEEPIDEEQNRRRFSKGFQQLPQAVESGEVTDEELTEIILNEELSPGIINRLIKTEMLEEQAIEAILEIDFQPEGVFKKTIYNIGFKSITHANKIAKEYEGKVSEKVKLKLAQHEDVSRSLKKSIIEQLEQKGYEFTEDGKLIPTKTKI